MEPEVARAFLGSFPPPAFGGRTRGTPKQVTFGHSSANMAHPFRRRFPISEEAESLCCRLRNASAVSTGGANIGELRSLENAVGGVELPEWCELDEMLGDVCVRSLYEVCKATEVAFRAVLNKCQRQILDQKARQTCRTFITISTEIRDRRPSIGRAHQRNRATRVETRTICQSLLCQSAMVIWTT
jgi:hypothetical protein